MTELNQIVKFSLLISFIYFIYRLNNENKEKKQIKETKYINKIKDEDNIKQNENKIKTHNVKKVINENKIKLDDIKPVNYIPTKVMKILENEKIVKNTKNSNPFYIRSPNFNETFRNGQFMLEETGVSATEVIGAIGKIGMSLFG